MAGTLEDERFMSVAIRLAHRGLGNVYPNPAVGCIVVKDGVVVGRGWTMDGGRPHAEVVALKYAGNAAKGATVYITLEPCCHQGATGPCTSELVQAGVARVVVATYDPDARVSGRGVSVLRESGIEVVCGIMQEQAEELNVGFFYNKTKGRPFITVKLATTLDGKMGFDGSSRGKRITGEVTRRWVHKQRSMYDAIMVGSNTILQDNPMLDCRLHGLEQYSPIRVIVDRCGKLRDSHNVVKTAHVVPTYVFTDRDVKALGDVCYVKVEGNRFLVNVVEKLAQMGITRLFVEGGAILATQFLKNKLVDRFIWCRAHRVFGDAGIAAIRVPSDTSAFLGESYIFKRIRSLSVGEDAVDIMGVSYLES